MIFGGKQLQTTVSNLLDEKRCKDNEEEYLSCIEMLESILRTGEIRNAEMNEIVHKAISSFHSHIGLGIIIRGKFSHLDCHLAARHNVVTGGIISGRQFPVITESYANEILLGPLTANLPYDCIWDMKTQTILHSRAYYIRHIDELMGLKFQTVQRLGLTDVFRQNLHRIR